MSQILNIQPIIKVPGMVLPYLGLTAPAGWLLCNGQAVDRAVFSTLLGELGLRYGNGNGSNTFNVPDLRGRFIKHTIDSNDVGRVIANNLDASAFPLDVTDSQAHVHSDGATNNEGDHSHKWYGENSSVNGNTVYVGGNLYVSYAWSSAAGGHTHAINSVETVTHTHTATITGGDGETRPVNMAVNYIISTGI